MAYDPAVHTLGGTPHRAVASHTPHHYRYIPVRYMQSLGTFGYAEQLYRSGHRVYYGCSKEVHACTWSCRLYYRPYLAKIQPFRSRAVFRPWNVTWKRVTCIIRVCNIRNLYEIICWSSCGSCQISEYIIQAYKNGMFQKVCLGISYSTVVRQQSKGEVYLYVR